MPLPCVRRLIAVQSDNFRELFEAIAEDAGIRVETLVVCFDGKRIFSGVGPAALKVWGKCHFSKCPFLFQYSIPFRLPTAAYTKQAFEYIRSNPTISTFSRLHEHQSQTQVPPSPNYASSSAAVEISDSDDDAGPSRSNLDTSASQTPPGPSRPAYMAAPAAEASEDEDDDTFKLILRSALTGNKDITLTVRPTTKCGNIVKAFLKKAKLEDQYPHVFAEGGVAAAMATASKQKKGRGRGKAAAPPQVKDPRLSVDGDKLDNDAPISDADLEDGDMVEVVGL